jgi:hypothetical protein
MASIVNIVDQTSAVTLNIVETTTGPTVNVAQQTGPTVNVVLSGGLLNRDLNYVHNQTSASSSWDITHNLNKFPAVSIVDSSGNIVMGDVQHLTNKRVLITFNATFSGKAYFN